VALRGMSPFRDSSLERPVKSYVDVVDGARRESGIKLLAIESAHVGRGQVLELHLTKHRTYVEADHLLLPLKGCRTYGVTHGISKPPPQVLTQLQIIGVETSLASLSALALVSLSSTSRRVLPYSVLRLGPVGVSTV